MTKAEQMYTLLDGRARQRYFLYRGATDMHKGFNGLSGLGRDRFPHRLLSGDVFDFTVGPFPHAL